MNELADIIARGGRADGNLARRVLEPLCEHERLVRYLQGIGFNSVRLLQPLAGVERADALPRAIRRAAELPGADELEGWYRLLRRALDDAPDEALARVLVALLLDTLRGRLDSPRVMIDGFVLALEDAGLSPQLVAGGVKRAWTTCKVKPSIAAFVALCQAHGAETQAALDQVCRAIGLRRDAEKVASRAGQAIAGRADDALRLQ